MSRLKRFLSKLSFRTGLIVLGICVVLHVLSFAQMLLPISDAVKGILWFWIFGAAKLFQYTGLVILGAEGVKRIKAAVKRRKAASNLE